MSAIDCGPVPPLMVPAADDDDVLEAQKALDDVLSVWWSQVGAERGITALTMTRVKNEISRQVSVVVSQRACSCGAASIARRDGHWTCKICWAAYDETKPPPAKPRVDDDDAPF